MATTVGTLAVIDQGCARLVDDLAHRGITATLTFTAAQDVEGGIIGSIAVTIPDSATNNATWGALGNVANSLSRT
jgi:hypothetical protein